MNKAMTTSSKDCPNANSAPEATAGAMDGTVTFKNATAGVAPQEAAALSKFLSSCSKDVSTGMMTNGMDMTAWARIIPVKVLTKPMRAKK